MQILLYQILDYGILRRMYNKLIINILLLSLSFSSLYSQTSNIERAYRLYRNKSYVKAAELFEYEVVNSPILKIEYFEILGSIYMMRNDYDNLLRISRNGILVNRHSSKLYFQKGYALYKLGRTNEAILAIKKSLTLHPTSSYMHNFIGLLYLREEDYKQAESSFLKATIYNPSSVVYLVNLGASYERQGNYRDALQSYEKSYKINPKYKGLLESLKRVRKILGDDNVVPPTEQQITPVAPKVIPTEQQITEQQTNSAQTNTSANTNTLN